jgi:4-amino-4-deoxy-L-arabinose transferase-like glycosyltransferase
VSAVASRPAESAPDDARGWRAAVWITVAAAVIRLALALRLPLFPDETYYWEWSRRLAGGYFDHPPMIAVLIRMGVVSVRFLPIVAGAVASLATAGIAFRLGGGRAARTAAVVLAVMPLVATGLVLATPDAPLLAAVAVGLYAVVRALQSPLRSRASLAWWTAAGLALGIAFTSKYTSILLPVSITIAVLLRPTLRARLREPGPWVACVVASVVFLPVLQWNAAHDWISFRFQLQHGLGTTSRGSPLTRELDLIGGQLGLVSPIIFALLAAAVWRALRRSADDVRWVLAVVATASWVFFVYSALRKSVEANWPAPSYVPAVALLAAGSLATSRWLRRGVALAAVLVGIVYLHAVVPFLPIPARKDPIARGAGWGWEGMAGRVSAARDSLAPGVDSPPPGARPVRPVRPVRGVPGARSWLGADRYQDVSQLAYYARDTAFCMCFTGRSTQYELWPAFPEVARPGDALLLVLDETGGGEVHGTAARVGPYFSSLRRGDLVPLLRGRDTVGVRRIWVLEGYRGGWPARGSR